MAVSESNGTTTYKISSDLLTGMANEIRTLNGSVEGLFPSEMTTALQSANAEVAEQEQKIIEITEMLQGKAMGGSGEDVTAEVTAQTELIADLESAVNALPEAGEGGGAAASLETGTLTTTTSLTIERDYNVYVDLESIPNIASKLLVVLQHVKSSYNNPTAVLTRSSADKDFALAATAGNNMSESKVYLSGYTFGIINQTYLIGELTYYAV